MREAAARGAQIICLKELFNAPYFCKSQKCERFDIAEPIPGPTTDVMQKLAKELEVVIIVPIFEKQARGVYRNSAAIIDADGSLLGVYRKMHIPDDPLFNEKYYFVPGDAAHDDRIDTIGEVAKQASGFRVWRTRYANIGVLICWDQWYPEAARITSLLGADILFYPTAIGWHPAEKAEFGAAQRGRMAHDPALARHRQRRLRRVAESRRPRGGAGHGRHRVLRPLLHRRPLRPHPRRSRHRGTEILIAECDPKLIEDTRRNWPFLRDRRIDAYAPILSRYLGV